MKGVIIKNGTEPNILLSVETLGSRLWYEYWLLSDEEIYQHFTDIYAKNVIDLKDLSKN